MKENGQNTEQPLTTLSVFRDARLCARVCVLLLFFFPFLLAFSNGLSMTAINRKITTIFKFWKLHYLSSLGTFQPLFYDFFVLLDITVTGALIVQMFSHIIDISIALV